MSIQDPFESKLISVDLLSNTGQTNIEKSLGLEGGGNWWLDITQPAVEIDADGLIDEGSIVDIEAHARAWMRHSFDRNPEFRDDSYHLLGRLSELAQLKGLVEQVALKHHQTDSSKLKQNNNAFRRADPISSNCVDPAQSYINLRQNYDSNLRLSYDVQNPTVLSKPEVYQEQAFTGNEMVKRLVPKFPGLPHLQKSQQPPSPHTSHLQRTTACNTVPSSSNLPCNFLEPNTAGSPDRLTVSQEWRKGGLNKTYSKEALDKLKENVIPPTRRSGGSLLDNFLKPPLNGSGPISDSASDNDLAKSAELVRLRPGVLSHSLNDGEFPDFQMSGGRTNASYSSMKSAFVLEVARLQESKLREHSGSFSKLNGSGSSINGSVGEMNAQGSTEQVRNLSIGSHRSSEWDLFRASHDGVVSKRLSPKPEPQSTRQIDALRDSCDYNLSSSTEYRKVTSGTMSLSDRRKGSLEPLTFPNQEKNIVNCGPITELPTPRTAEPGPSTAVLQTKAGPATDLSNVFFPVKDASKVNVQTTNLDRLNSQTSFEEMEMRVSREHFLLESLEGTNVSASIPDSILLDNSVVNSREIFFSPENDTEELSMDREGENESGSFTARKGHGSVVVSRLRSPPNIRSALKTQSISLSSRLPTGPYTRIPTPSESIISANANRSRPSSAHSSLSRRGARQLTSHSKSTSKPSIPASDSFKRPPVTGDTRVTVQPKANPAVHRSDTSPVRSTSRRFAPTSTASNKTTRRY